MLLVVANIISHYKNDSILRLGVLPVHPYKICIIEYFELLEKLWLYLKWSVQKKNETNFINISY